MTDPPLRLCFVANSAGTVAEVLLNAPVGEAYDIMVADGVPPQGAADMAAAAERAGKDPVAWARHFVKLRGSLRTYRETG